MKRQITHLIAQFLLIISCLLAGCANVGVSGSSAAPIAVSAPQAEKVALLLPLDGQYGPSAQAIRNGYMAAYYADKQNTANAPTVTVINTNGDASGNYNQAVSGGANFIVGPLTKPQVQGLASHGNLQVITLALNSLDSSQSIPNNLYFYSLSPRQEAMEVAAKARQDGHQNAIIIAASANQSVANSFAQQFQAAGGHVVDSLVFAPKQDLAGAMASLLHVDKTITTSKGFKDAQKNKTPLQQLRRQDFDMVFIAASPSQARLIRPLLKFYFAGNVSAYATSSIYSGTPSPNSDRDLDGIMFPDMPWVLGQLSPDMSGIKSRIATLWPDSTGGYSKLYAMGVDAYQMTVRFNQLNSGINGATGRLSMGPGHQVQRQLSWARFVNGVPVAL